MKLLAELPEDDPAEHRIILYTVNNGDCVVLKAKDLDKNGTTKNILHFYPNGTVVRCTQANIGSFEFNGLGQIVIVS